MWQVTTVCYMLGRVNGGLKEKKLVVIESTFTDSMLGKVEELLKSPTVIIEERRRDAEQVLSYHRVVMISPAPVPDRARRFFTVQCDRVDGFENDVAYNCAFESLMDHLEKRYILEGVSIFFWCLVPGGSGDFGSIQKPSHNVAPVVLS